MPRYGRLSVDADDQTRGRKAKWRATCDCGNVVYVRADGLKNGHTQSCGCLRLDAIKSQNGLSKHPLFVIWCGMVARCTRPGPNQHNFSYYGGRGISVCERWLRSFENFLADVPPRPSDDHQIERIDNNGNYEPGNVCWATRKEQGRNKRNNVIVEVDGRKMCLSEAAELCGLPYQRVHLRMRRGWSAERALEIINGDGENSAA